MSSCYFITTFMYFSLCNVFNKYVVRYGMSGSILGSGTRNNLYYLNLYTYDQSVLEEVFFLFCKKVEQTTGLLNCLSLE